MASVASKASRSFRISSRRPSSRRRVRRMGGSARLHSTTSRPEGARSTRYASVSNASGEVSSWTSSSERTWRRPDRPTPAKAASSSEAAGRTRSTAATPGASTAPAPARAATTTPARRWASLWRRSTSTEANPPCAPRAEATSVVFPEPGGADTRVTGNRRSSCRRTSSRGRGTNAVGTRGTPTRGPSPAESSTMAGVPTHVRLVGRLATRRRKSTALGAAGCVLVLDASTDAPPSCVLATDAG